MLQEMEQTIQEVWALFRETDKKFRETDKRFKETDRLLSQKFKETDRLLSQKFKETDTRFKETDKKFKETDKKLQEKIQIVSQNVDKLTGKWGRFVEGLVAPGISRLFGERGIAIETVAQRVRTSINSEAMKLNLIGPETMEIDVLGLNKKHAILVEVKSTLGIDDINDHIEQLNNFKHFFPEYADRQVMGAVAGIVIEENVSKFAYRRGLFVIGQSGDTVTILNDTKFRPEIW
jgi:hypothetical protein